MNWSMGLCGVVLSSLPALCASRRSCERNIERVVFEVRTEIAKVCQQTAVKCGEPPFYERR